AARVLADQAAALAGRAAIVMLPQDGSMRLAAGPEGLSDLSEATLAAARQVWDSGLDAEDGSWAMRPLQGVGGQVGVIGLRGPRLPADQEGLLTAVLRQGAVALERASLAVAAAELEGLRRADHLRSALLNSISHDFRTPLATVLGSSTTLLDFEAELKPAVRRDLLESIAQAARRLNRYVGDLLDMSRLEGGALTPRRELTDVRAVLASAVDRLEGRLDGRPIRRDFAERLSRVNADPTLLEQAVLNIIENAAAYSPPGAPIELAVHEDLGHVLIAIEDAGPGIPPEALEQVFDRFRRLNQPTDRGHGLGLGLSIAKGFVEAMGGRIAASSPVADGHGTRVLIALPKPHPTPKDLM
ncbi:MAG: ATP-binding protein, partial [Pseudomonadota bacterium]